MDKLCFILPKKAKDLIEELAQAELNQVSFYMYLSFCCSNLGFYKAADHFMSESKNERYHFKRLCDFLQTRGIEPDVPAVAMPKIPFTDLRSGIEAAYKLEIDITEKYDEAIRIVRDVDIMAALKLESFMQTQEYALDGLSKMWAVFGDTKEVEDQRELEQTYWPDPNPEGIVN